MAQQIHSGEGDNVAGNKNVQNTFTLRTKLLAVAILVAAGGLIFIPDLLPKPAPLHGYVVSSAEIPIAGAKVTFTADDQAPITVFTDEKGAFLFEMLDAKKLDAFRLDAQVEARKVQERTNGVMAIAAPVVLKLPAGTPPYDLYYFDLEGGAISDLVAGKVSPELEDQLGRQPFISVNEVHIALKELSETFGYIGDYSGGDWIPDGTRDLMGEARSALVQGSGDWYQGEQRISAAEMRQLFGEEERLQNELEASQIPWDQFLEHPTVKALAAVQERIFGAWKYIEADVLQQIGGEWPMKPIYRHLVQEELPPDFLKVTLLGQRECGYEVDKIGFKIIEPLASVKVVVMANNTRNALEIDSFSIKANRQERLRTVSADTIARRKSDVFEKKLFPGDRINPGELLLIPLEIHYVFESGTRKADQAKEYVYGPSWEITGVEVGIEEYPFRKKKAKVLALINSLGFGSCPYAFTFDERTEIWRLEDHIIANQNSPEKVGYDTISLNRFNGELIIRELDPEVSYLDFIEVLEVRNERDTIRYSLDHDLLAQQDGQAFFMEQGDEIHLDFGPLVPGGAGEVKFLLVAYGYYVVNEVD